MKKGQANLEYALLIVLMAVLLIVVLAALGSWLAGGLNIFNSTPQAETPSAQITETPVPSPISVILSDMQTRIQDYFAARNRYPRTWSPYNFTDVGSTPSDWSQPVEGLYWSPHGSEVGIANRRGDNLEVYVDDLNGNTLHLFNNWSIWCPVTSQYCYYHTVAPGNEVDISTITVTGQ